MNPERISQWLERYGLNAGTAEVFGLIGAVLYLFLLALLANFLTKRFVAYLIHPVIRKTRIKWDDLLIEHGIIVRFSHIVPALIIHLFTPTLFQNAPGMVRLIERGVSVYLVIIVLFIINGLLNFVRSIWDQNEIGRRYSSKSFIQATKLIVNLVGLVLVVSSILDKSPILLLSGLGALTAILLLIFKDAILGLVAGFQLSINNMAMVGDWIEMPARGADGDVVDVSLTTVKVRNWDNTITTLPTYSLISDSFKNWRGMSESGGRRIKRAIYVDMRTIRFVDATLLERFKSIRLLRPYLEEKLKEIREYNDKVGEDLAELINGRRLTNIGTFRAYCVAYLRNHRKIHQNMTLIVRQLAPNSNGLPIEIYLFTNDTAWDRYEDIQGDIFDHFLSVLPEFGLSPYQAPGGSDIEKAGRTIASAGQ